MPEPLHSPAAERNRQPILQVLQTLLPGWTWGPSGAQATHLDAVWAHAPQPSSP